MMLYFKVTNLIAEQVVTTTDHTMLDKIRSNLDPRTRLAEIFLNISKLFDKTF